MSNQLEPRADFRSGYVTLVGKPNVGKSTLLNQMVGQKLAIVSPKPQTTRHRVMGILTDERHQLIFLDTPGLLAPRYRLQEAMLGAARRAIQEADVVLAVHDVTRPLPGFDRVMREASPGPGRTVIVLNKVDRVAKGKLLPLIGELGETNPGVEIVPVSALKGDNVDRLLDVMHDAMAPGPALYPVDALTEQPERFFVSEIVREQVLFLFQEEVPYSVQVEIEAFEEGEGGLRDTIHAVVCVERDSQKRILVGKAGAAIKELGIRSREEIEAFLGRRVILKLFVKVVKEWRSDPRALRRMGYES